MSNQPFIPNGIWKGYIHGTNMGVLYVRFHASETQLRAKAFFTDNEFGPTTVLARRDLLDQKQVFILSHFSVVAPLVPSGGALTLTFDEQKYTADGTWATDIGTGGTCKISATKISRLSFVLKIFLVQSKWFIIRWLPRIYLLILLEITIASLFEKVHLTALNLILLLLPIPFLFAKQLEKLIGILRAAKIKKLGPLEFDQVTPSPDIVAAASQHQHAESFKALNKFFVARTKFILSVVANKGEVTPVEFVELAKSVGTPEDNIQQTIDALIQTLCMKLESGKLIATHLGKDYIKNGLRFGT